MAEWLKAKLFGRQLSHGSENEEPQSFEEAFQTQNIVPNLDPFGGPPPQLQQQQQAPSPYQQAPMQQMPGPPMQQMPGPPMQQMPGPPMQQMPGPPMQQMPGPPMQQMPGAAAPGVKEMNAAYMVSKQLVRERMERENPEDVAILDSVKDNDIICVKGTFDHIHLVLEAIGIPFAHVDPHQLLKMELKPEQTIYVNCPSSFPDAAAAKLKTFVEQGGQLITTDWALKNVLEKAFPRTVRFSGTSTGDEVVAIEIVEKDDDILRGFLDQEKDAAPVWWLENSSYPIEILDKKRVKVLVRSDELKRRYKHEAVIISFEWGKGIVYHMISHFYLQRSETRTKKQGTSSSSYAAAQGASKTTMDMFNVMQEQSPAMNYGMVQSAATSSEFVSRCLVKQKRKFASKS